MHYCHSHFGSSDPGIWEEKRNGTKETKRQMQRILLKCSRLTWLKYLVKSWWFIHIFRYFNQETLGMKYRGKCPFLSHHVSVSMLTSTSLLWVGGFLGMNWRLLFSPHTHSPKRPAPAFDHSAWHPCHEKFSHLCKHCFLLAILWELQYFWELKKQQTHIFYHIPFLPNKKILWAQNLEELVRRKKKGRTDQRNIYLPATTFSGNVQTFLWWWKCSICCSIH